MLARPGHHATIDTDANGDGSAIWGNPQAELSESSFSSAIRRNDTTPAKRRRGSDAPGRRGRTDHDPWASTEGSHSRSRTMDDEAGTGAYWLSGSSTGQHPLRHSGSVPSSSMWTLDHETRPTMRRMLSDQSIPNGRQAEPPSEGSAVQDREMLVIVHEVQPRDSLAGVALKYGISLAELRRANQLWTSDSIHLRKVLYIPVDKTRHAKHLREAIIETFMPSDDPLPASSTPSESPSEPTHHPPSTNDNLPDIGKLTLRRVPASQLSYFPPPTHSSTALESIPSASSSQASATLPNGRSSRSRPALPISFARSTDSPLQGVLDVFSSSFRDTANQVRAYGQSTSSFFGGPPARAPTTLASRLSLDSTSGTPSTVSEDFDWEHEMEDVSSALSKAARRGTNHDPDRAARSRARARQASASLNDLTSSPPPTVREQERESVELDAGPFPSAAGPRTPTRRHRRDSSGRVRTPPSTGSKGRDRSAAPYIGTEAEEGTAAEWGSPGRSESIVRTAQLQPSAAMQLPLLPRKRVKSTDS